MVKQLKFEFAECYLCDQYLADVDNNGAGYAFWAYSEGSLAVACLACSATLADCRICRVRTDIVVEVYRGSSSWSPVGAVCGSCRDEDYYCCSGCEGFFTYLHSSSDDYCSDCYECGCGECDCSDCFPEGCECEDCRYGSGGGYIESYSYKPAPKFYGTPDGGSAAFPAPGIPYFGVELEITVGDRNGAAERLTVAADGLIYCKEDSSVRGIEAVTHPMTLAAAGALLPFGVLADLESEGADGEDTGIHVHVSRNGFADDLHVLKWFRLLYRNADDVQRIGRRDSGEWGSFRNGSEKVIKQSAKKRGGRGAAPRYSAINPQNRETFEVRVFCGSLKKVEIMAAIELVAASVEYTRTLATYDILRNGGWTWQAFIAWASADGAYPNLVELDAALPAADSVSDVTSESPRFTDECGDPECGICAAWSAPDVEALLPEPEPEWEPTPIAIAGCPCPVCVEPSLVSTSWGEDRS